MTKMPRNPDKKILTAIRGSNSQQGWDLLFELYDPIIQAITRWSKWHFSEDEQLDVRQNIHLHLQSALPTFQEKSSLVWFIKQIAIRQCINEVRRQKRWSTVITPLVRKSSSGYWNELEFEDPDGTDPYTETTQNERRESLHSALQEVAPTCKESISLYYLRQHSYLEISKKLGISIRTVGSRLSKCLDKLHRQLRYKPAFKEKYK